MRTAAQDGVGQEGAARERWRRPLGLLFFILVGLSVLWHTVVYPLLDREAMKGPMSGAVNAVQRGDAAAVQACFTPDAVMAAGKAEILATRVITAAAPWMAENRGSSRLRFAGYGEVKPLARDRVTTTATVVVFIEGNDDLPYKQVPVRKQGTVELQRVGFLQWKIRRLTSEDADFGNLVSVTADEATQ